MHGFYLERKTKGGQKFLGEGFSFNALKYHIKDPRFCSMVRTI